MNNYDTRKSTQVVGNNFTNDQSLGFKEEIKQVFESYNAQGINLCMDLGNIITSPTRKATFVNQVMESLTGDSSLTNEVVTSNLFYGNYADRVQQLEDNSLRTIALESIMTNYSPIVAYAPFFLKNQWVNCVYKDVLMTEIPTSPIINIAYEKRFIVDQAGVEYPIPQVCYDDAIMAKLMGEATGLKIDNTKVIPLPLNENILNATYIPDIVIKPGVELTPDIAITEVTFTKGAETKSVPTNIRVDITTLNFIKGDVTYNVLDAGTGEVTETWNDKLVGYVNFDTGSVSVMSSAPVGAAARVTSIKLSGTLANRFNERSLDVRRKVERIEFVMPESGPRFNSGITIEESADALMTQNVDMIADNVDVMGKTLADFEDIDLRTFLRNSFNVQEAAGVGPHGYEKLTVSAKFDTLPYSGYQGNVSTWQRDIREFFERAINVLKMKLKSDNVAFVAVMNPQLVRYFKDSINWGFTNDMSLSGVKLNYQFGIMTSTSEKINFITSQYAKVTDGVTIVAIPMQADLFTYKHYKYNVVVDRGYRNPLHALIPNIMATQRTLNVEILPVQGKFVIEGMQLDSPTTLVR